MQPNSPHRLYIGWTTQVPQLQSYEQGGHVNPFPDKGQKCPRRLNSPNPRSSCTIIVCGQNKELCPMSSSIVIASSTVEAEATGTGQYRTIQYTAQLHCCQRNYF